MIFDANIHGSKLIKKPKSHFTKYYVYKQGKVLAEFDNITDLVEWAVINIEFCRAMDETPINNKNIIFSITRHSDCIVESWVDEDAYTKHIFDIRDEAAQLSNEYRRDLYQHYVDNFDSALTIEEFNIIYEVAYEDRDSAGYREIEDRFHELFEFAKKLWNSRR